MGLTPINDMQRVCHRPTGLLPQSDKILLGDSVFQREDYDGFFSMWYLTVTVML
jgi:hypothetical protein